jgi:hypothetical protein
VKLQEPIQSWAEPMDSHVAPVAHITLLKGILLGIMCLIVLKKGAKWEEKFNTQKDAEG